MAESVASLVVEKLVLLSVQEAKLLKGIDQEVTTIRYEMAMIQAFLRDADKRAEKDEESDVAKTWVTQVREEAYHIEDVIDQYMLHFAKQPHRRRQCLYFLQKIFHITIHIKDLHVIASEIQGINKILENIRSNGEKYGFNAKEQGTSSSNVESDTWHDPRTESFLIEEAEVVGFEFYRDELIDWLIEGSSNRMVCSVVGTGGLGKTTLVKKVYDNDKVVPHFDCHAWITVSQSYKMDQLLRDMIKKFYKARKEFAPREIDTMEEPSLIKELNTYLLEQRYLLVLDDIWDTGLWDHIKRAFPDNAKGNRIIITTRNVDVAPSNNESQDYSVYELEPLPFEKALELFYKKAFQCNGGQCPEDLVELSNEIVERCGGLPLAIVAIGGLFSTKAKVESEWRKVFDSLSSEFETNSRLRSITKILSFSYQDLPYNLKACFLYFGMFPEDYTINCATLTRLWIAEGFVKEKGRLTLEDVAQDFLNQLIRRSLVQVDWEDFMGRIRNCRVHDMMHEIILSRLEELGIGQVSMTDFSNSERTARRLSIQNNVNTRLHGINNSQTRSIIILEVDEVPNSFLITCFANFKLMKVMDFEGAPIDCIPKEVGSLFHLRYLSLRDTKVQMLPKSIGKLHNLETLDLKRSLVSKLPVEISGLCKLRYLAAYNIKRDTEYNLGSRRAVKIPNGIGRLESLQKLFNIEATNATIITELGSLAQLRKLAICKLKKENGRDLCTVIQKLRHLRSLEVNTTSEEEVLNLQSLPSPPPLLQTLCLGGRLEKLPEWISKLKNIVRIVLNWSKLMEDPLKFFQALPNLMSLTLNDGYGGEQLHIEGGGFQKLEELALRDLGGLNRLIIDEGALPLLEQLTIKHCPKLEEVPSGIHHLESLEHLDFYDMPTEFVLSLQPDEGPNFGKVEHIPSVTFWYRTEGKNYDGYDLGESELLEYLKR